MRTFLNRLHSLLSVFVRMNWTKTLYVNFRMLPLKDALKLPIVIFGRCRLSLKGGQIQIQAPIKRAMLKIGYRYETFDFKEPSQIKIHGIFTLRGEVWFGSSVCVLVEPGGHLIMGHSLSVGSCSSVVCTKRILFSGFSHIGSFLDVSDSNYHYLKNLNDNSILPFSKSIEIGLRNYIGSRVALLPGTVTPNNVTIGFGSVCNKDYRNIIPENSVIAGMPAKLVKENTVGVLDLKKEAAITKYFAESNNDIYYDE